MDSDSRWKWVDDLTVLEIINLINIGISSFNIRSQIPNDINIDKHFIPKENLKTQDTLNSISDCTKNQMMMLNKKKTNYMIFNYTKKYQFNSRLYFEGDIIKEKEKVKLLGTIITNDLKWEDNTKEIIKKANARMCLLRAISSFSAPKSDLITIYIQYIRSHLEQSCVVWHSSLTQEDRDNIERVQKNALRIILKQSYKSYENALDVSELEKLDDRRTKLSLKFAKNYQKSVQTKDIFQHKEIIHNMKLRQTEKYIVNNAFTSRYQESAVPYMQKLLNKHNREQEAQENKT